MKKVAKEQIWQFWVDKGQGEEEVGRKVCRKPRNTRLWKILEGWVPGQQEYSYGCRVINEDNNQ